MLLLVLFLAEKAFDDDGNLKQPKQLSINKVGHGLSQKMINCYCVFLFLLLDP